MAKMNDVRVSHEEREKSFRASDRSRSGIHMHLDHEHLKKMGVKKPPKPGSHVHLKVKARVTSASTHHDEDGNPRHSMSLEITHARMGDAPDAGKSVKDVVDEALAEGRSNEKNIGGDIGSED